MKILFIITGLGIGGAEKQVVDLADEYTYLGHNVTIMSLTNEIITKPKSSTVNIINMKMKKNFFSFLKTYIAARKLIKNISPEIVHSHMVHANLFARFLRITVKIPLLVCTAHSSFEGSRLRMFMYRITDRLCNVTTNVSNEATESSIRRKSVKKNRIITMYNGIDTSRFRFNISYRNEMRHSFGLDRNTPLLLAVGRLQPAKDYPNLLHAFANLPPEYSHAKLFIIGGGDEEKALKTLSNTLGINKRVIFLGFRNDIEKWISAADVFILSSAWEGFGLVVAEAMSSECIVVATDCGGVKEVLNGYGFLVPTKDSVYLSEKIVHAISLDHETKNKMKKSSKKYVLDNFSIETIAKKWLGLYTSLLSKLG